MRMVLKSGFDVFSGYGNDAVDLAVWLDKIGVDITVYPTSCLPPLPRAFTRLLERNPLGRKDVVVQFAAPPEIRPWELEKTAPRRVGYTMWEKCPMLVQDFTAADWMKNGEPQNISWAGLDGMIVTCPMNVDALAPFLHGCRTAVVPCGIDPDTWPEKPRPTSDRLTFLMVGMLNGRKNPFAAINAWRELKAERPDFDARLHLHTLAPGLHPKLADTVPDLQITSRPVSREDLIGMYHGAHVYLSTSRGEGNNKPAMEFMATGGTVAATDWAGHRNWLLEDACYLLPGELQENRDGACDFNVDHQALKDTLLHCWENRAEVTKKGEFAAGWIRSSHSWERLAERFAQQVASWL